jgi:hypothetical protein
VTNFDSNSSSDPREQLAERVPYHAPKLAILGTIESLVHAASLPGPDASNDTDGNDSASTGS